jgi:hypothetical protein
VFRALSISCASHINRSFLLRSPLCITIIDSLVHALDALPKDVFLGPTAAAAAAAAAVATTTSPGSTGGAGSGGAGAALSTPAPMARPPRLGKPVPPPPVVPSGPALERVRVPPAVRLPCIDAHLPRPLPPPRLLSLDMNLYSA